MNSFFPSFHFFFLITIINEKILECLIKMLIKILIKIFIIYSLKCVMRRRFHIIWSQSRKCFADIFDQIICKKVFWSYDKGTLFVCDDKYVMMRRMEGENRTCWWGGEKKTLWIQCLVNQNFIEQERRTKTILWLA